MKGNRQEFMQIGEEGYRTLFASMPVGVFAVRPDGAITYANPAALDILGISMSELLSRVHTDARWRNIHKDGSEFPSDNLPSSIALRTGQAVRNVTIGIFNQRQNAYRWVHGSATPQFLPGETSPYRIYVTMEDIPERKKLEQEVRTLNTELEERVRRRTDELAAANKELEAFSYSVSHDLRAPLRSIDGFSQAFLEDYGSTVPKEGREELERVRRATQRMGQLIDDMLVLSQVTRSQMHMQQTDMSALATEVADELAQEHPQRDIQLSIEPGMTAPDLTPGTSRSCLSLFSGFTRWRNSRAPVSALPPSRGRSAATEETRGLRVRLGAVRRSSSPFQI